MEQKIVNWGIISCADIAEQRFVPGLLGAKNAKLYAVSSRGKGEKLTRFQQKFNPVKAYASYDELLEDPAIDAVYIPLPNGLHAEWTIKALEKGKHVLCEKPMGINVEEVKRMQAASVRTGKLLMEAFAYRQSPLTLKAKSLIEEGAVGTVRFIDSHYDYPDVAADNVRLSAKLAGGATFDVGCYNLNLIRFLVGQEPVSIHTTGNISETGVDINSAVLLAFPNGVTATATCGMNAFQRSEYTVHGDKGILHVPYEFNTAGATRIIVKDAAGVREIPIESPNNYMLEAEQFSRAVLGEEKPLISFEETLGNAVVIEEMLRQIFNRGGK